MRLRRGVPLPFWATPPSRMRKWAHRRCACMSARAVQRPLLQNRIAQQLPSLELSPTSREVECEGRRERVTRRQHVCAKRFESAAETKARVESVQGRRRKRDLARATRGGRRGGRPRRGRLVRGFGRRRVRERDRHLHGDVAPVGPLPSAVALSPPAARRASTRTERRTSGLPTAHGGPQI